MTHATICIAPASEKHIGKIEEIYLSSFPEAERRPWETIVRPESDKGPLLHSITMKAGCAESLLGFITLWNFDDFIYVEHFAIDEALRGFNLGARVLSKLRKTHKTIVLEVEMPSDNNPVAARRIDFYRRNGFEIVNDEYIQPPYGPGLPSVQMYLMSSNPAVDTQKAAQNLHREVYHSDI